MDGIDRQRMSLFVILALAVVLRFYQLGAADVISDEALIAFRSVGYIDYLASPDQPTTWERFDGSVPVWAYLSFHDHPPLTFLVQGLSFKLFGVNTFALRLPFALAGVAAVYLVYLICRQLFHESAALIAALLVAVNSATVWVSRIGLQESLLIFLALLAVYWYRRALDDHRFLPFVGLALGLGLLTKYTIVAVAAALLVHFFIYRREYFRLRTFWLGAAVFGLLALPMIIYNVMLYQMSGHFDLQLSYLLGQSVGEWQSLPGKEQIGSWPERLINFGMNFSGMLSWPALVAVVLAVVLFVPLWFTSTDPESSYTLLGLLTLSWAGMLLLAGPSTRFLSVLVAWLLILTAVTITALRTPFKPLRYLLGLVAVGALIFEFLFTVQTTLAVRPSGVPGIAYSRLLRSDLEQWGYQELDKYLTGALAGQRPAVLPEVRHEFLKAVQERAVRLAQARGARAEPLLIIYDANLYNLGALWTLHRRLVYDGWPVVTADQFLAQGEGFWRNAGVREFLFVYLMPGVLAEPTSEQTDGGLRLANQLDMQGAAKGAVLSPHLGTAAFTVYHWGSPQSRGKEGNPVGK